MMNPINLPTEQLAAPVTNLTFLGLASVDLEQLSQQAVTLELQRKSNLNLPITIWNAGQPYRKHPDGRIEHITL